MSEITEDAAATSSEETVTEHRFQAQVSEVLSLVINSLYSNREIFLRELLSNASDALDKQRFAAVTDAAAGDDAPLVVQLVADSDKGTLTISDNGIGMSQEELVQNLGTIAHSGSKAFLEQIKAKQEGDEDLSLIGQFGVGFYSAYLVADRVEVISRRAGASQAYRWESDAKDGFSTAPAERADRGTSIVLHLKEDQKALLSTWKLRELVKRYSDYIAHPIELEVEREVERAEGEEDAETAEQEEKKTEKVFEKINEASALWQRSSSDISDEQYQEFYKHLTHDWESPAARRHFKVEGTQLFTGLLFIPSQPPFDLFTADKPHGIRLHVKRVFIMDECEELLPRWLRFVRGVIDSEDLPLNVSRELLQDSRIVKVIRKQVVKHCVDMLMEVAEREGDDYLSLWKHYGSVLKEGLHFEPEHKEKIAKLLRYESSAGESLTSLTAYVERMKEAQPAIYYAMGPSRAAVENSPHLEALKKRGYEVLFMTDTVDQWATQGLDKFQDKPMVSAMNAELKLDSEDEQKEAPSDASLEPLIERFKKVLEEHVSEVRLSDRLTDSPACLVLPDGGLQPYIERLLRAQQALDAPATKRILEINGDHPLIAHLRTLHTSNAEDSSVGELIELLYDQALLAEGTPVDNPSRLAQRLTQMMQDMAGRSAAEVS